MRKKTKRVLLSALLSFSLLATSVAVTGPVSGGGEAQAADDGFVDLSQEEIVEAMGAGWNYGNQLEAVDGSTPKEDAWSHYTIEKRVIQRVALSGFQSIRFPVTWTSLIGDAPDYKLDEARLARLQEVVQWALDADMYAIINIHGDGYSTVPGGWLLPGKPDEEQAAIKEKYAKVWEQLATAFKDYDQHLIFESMNEVGADIAEKSNVTQEEIQAAYQNINDYNQIFLDTVRKSGGNNDKRWVLVPGMNTNLEYTAGYDSDKHADKDYGFRLPEDAYLSKEVPEGEKRIMVSVHYYSPWEFCGGGDYRVTQWGWEADPKRSVGYQGEDYMEEVFAVLKDKFTSKGYPVVIGEYGAVDKSQREAGQPENTEFRKYFAYKLCTEARLNGLVPVWWDNGDTADYGYALFDRSNGGKAIQPEIIEGIMNAYGDGDDDGGTATGIKLSQKYLRMETNDESFNLEAAVEPDNSEDRIDWRTSDASVASVTYKGTVGPKGPGTCLITATTASGKSDYCIVEVVEAESLKLALYATGADQWTALEGDNYLKVSPASNAVEDTVTLTMPEDFMKAIHVLYFKDVTVERKVSKESIAKTAQMKMVKAEFNGHELKLASGLDKYTWTKDLTLNAKNEYNDPAPDYNFLNAWYEPARVFEDAILDSSQEVQGYHFPDEYYVSGDNTLSITMQLDGVTFDKEPAPEKPATSLELSSSNLTLGVGRKHQLQSILAPADTTEKVVYFSESPKVATVDKDGVISALKEGETVIHALTKSGQDVTCTVTVAEDDGTLETPTPAPGGDDNPSPTPGTGDGNPSPTPGAGDGSPSPTPGGDNNGGNNNGGGSNGGETNNGGGSTNATVKVKKVTLQKVKPTKKKTLLVQWKKLSGATGYQVQLSTDKKFKKGVKKYTVKKAKTTKKTIKKLKSKKTYYARVCAYKTVSGKKYTGSWSKVKKAKVK